MSALSDGSVVVSRPIEPLNYSIPDAATRLGVSRQTIYRLHRKGYLTIYKFGRRSLITVEDINSCQRKMIERKMPRDIRGEA
jgi:excisionase family DNA binding protein